MAWWQNLILGGGALVLLWALIGPLVVSVLSKIGHAFGNVGEPELTTDQILAFLPRLASWCDANGIDGHQTWIAIRQRCSEIDTPLPGDREVEQ